MLSRKTTKTLAEIYHEKFKGSTSGLPGLSGSQKYYLLKKSFLYDFLYENDYEAWFLNAVDSLGTRNERILKEFIMRLHTGETVVPVTQDWSWKQRSKLGQRFLQDLAEDMLCWAQNSESYVTGIIKGKISMLISELELDGYIFSDWKLYYSEAAVLDTEDEIGILEKLVKDLNLYNQDTIKHHLDLSETHYIDEKWDDSIANSRKFLESILQEIAARHHQVETGKSINSSLYSTPFKIRDYLENQGLIERKEKNAISSVYGLLSETGSHPYIAQKDQARLMRYLSLTFAQFALLRFQGFLMT